MAVYNLIFQNHIKAFVIILNLVYGFCFPVSKSSSTENSYQTSIFRRSTGTTSTTKDYPAILQPEYDGFNLTQYFRTTAHVKFQVRCFFYNGPCDILSKWAKPRFPAAIFGKCDNCTKMQETYLDDAFLGLYERLPQLFETAVAAVLEHYGIQVPLKYRKRIAKVFET